MKKLTAWVKQNQGLALVIAVAAVTAIAYLIKYLSKPSEEDTTEPAIAPRYGSTWNRTAPVVVPRGLGGMGRGFGTLGGLGNIGGSSGGFGGGRVGQGGASSR